MAVSVTFFKSFKDYLGDGAINLNTADLRAIPVLNYTFDHTDDFVDDVTGSEVTTNGGSRIALTGESWALSSNNGRFDCDDITFTAAGGSLVIDGFILADYTGSSADTDREVICHVDNSTGTDLTAADGLDIVFQTPSGLFEIQ